MLLNLIVKIQSKVVLRLLIKVLLSDVLKWKTKKNDNDSYFHDEDEDSDTALNTSILAIWEDEQYSMNNSLTKKNNIEKSKRQPFIHSTTKSNCHNSNNDDLINHSKTTRRLSELFIDNNDAPSSECNKMISTSLNVSNSVSKKNKILPRDHHDSQNISNEKPDYSLKKSTEDCTVELGDLVELSNFSNDEKTNNQHSCNILPHLENNHTVDVGELVELAQLSYPDSTQKPEETKGHGSPLDKLITNKQSPSSHSLPPLAYSNEDHTFSLVHLQNLDHLYLSKKLS